MEYVIEKRLKFQCLRFDNLWLAILIRNILRLSLLCLLFLLPRADPSGLIHRRESLDSKVAIDHSLESKNVELVSLVSSVEVEEDDHAYHVEAQVVAIQVEEP
ncbi:hypothetical protein Ahy_B06g085732 [Arachis hypogaea]|uniref:Uncharacterized protein n=1 Tax=Arachis hypogaea TaxID=3818 RepID=A0A444YVE5_ARAHY|nr:hypothetical protein Ahy_B06g085732 [Arachis hypogaea]